LKGVGYVVRFAQDPAADAEHHRAMTPDEFLKGGFLAPGEEALEEYSIGQLAALVTALEAA
jgi:hypothetical protein